MQDKNESSKRFAMKRMNKGHLKTNNMIESVCWEKDIMFMINTRFVINLLKTFNDEKNIYFLMDPGLGGTLYKVLTDHSEVFSGDTSTQNQKGFPAAFYVGCITLGLEHLHERNIAYRDLKPENVLLDERGYAKICDMGFARFVLGKTNTLAGTPDYMAPEMIDFPHTHNQSVDWWALGVLAFELQSGQCPWEDEGISADDDPHGRLLAIRRSQERSNPRFPYSTPTAMKNFITKLLQKPGKRLGTGGAQEIKKELWFTSVGINFDRLRDMLINPPYLPAPFQVPRKGSEDWEEAGDDQECDYEPDPNDRWSQRFVE
jgi:serine/threonine protein kinase